MKKKLFLIALLLVFALISCGGEEEDDDWGNDGDTPSGGDVGNGDNGLEEWKINWGAEEEKPSQTKSIIIDSNDIIYVAGNTYGKLYSEMQGEKDVFLAAFNSKGKELWGIQLGSNSTETAFVGLAVDEQNNLYIATKNSIQEKHLMKFSSDGVKIWDKSLEVQGIAALAVDGSGNIYVGTAKSYDILKFSTDGEKLSSYNFYAAQNTYNSITKIIVDSDGNIYAGGATSENLFATLTSTQDSFLVKIAPNGTVLWGKQWGGTANFNKISSVLDMLIDSDNNLYLPVPSEHDYVLLKISPTGDDLWESPKLDIGVPVSLSLDTLDKIYICGSNKVYKYSSDGKKIWSWKNDERYVTVQGIASDSKNNIYVLGIKGGKNIYLMKIPASAIK